ncbi:MAG: arginine--tRNA ligase [Acidobacteriota bacterium]
MLLELQRTIKAELQKVIKRVFALDLLPAEISVEIPPRAEMGDLAFPIAFELARRFKATTGTKQNPRQLAEQLRGELGQLEGVTRVETAGAGYLNFFFDRGRFLDSVLSYGESLTLDETLGGKLIVEHTSINPNKAAHIGHLRNAVLGDTVVRLLRASGEEVEVHNYIDNTGVQVADVVVGFKYLEKKSLEEIAKLTERFDYYCWDLYARVGKFYEESPENLRLRNETLHELESGAGETAKMADHISQRILRCHLNTMLRLGIIYDLLPRESDVLRLNFWQQAFEKLKEKDAIYYETEGRNKGCWVMRAESKFVPAGDAAEKEESEYEQDKILVRSNGTITYTGKDIAYHLWKLGLLGLNFTYRTFFFYPNGNRAWITVSDNADQQELRTMPLSPQFGNSVAYFNVIDVGQSYLQNYVKLGVKLMAPNDPRVDRSAHIAYEKVVLTPASASELGYELSEEESSRSQVAMSGRKGLGVKVDDLIDKLEEKALVEVKRRQADASENEQQKTAHQIAIGALRYFLLKFTRNSIIAFDFDEALAFEGETGPYIQYAVVRINSIFRKIADEGETSVLHGKPSYQELGELLTLKDESGWDGDYLWSLLFKASQLKEVLRISVNTLEPTHLAKYAQQLARSFSEFYNAKNGGKYIYKIIDETDPDRRRLLISLAGYIRHQLERALELMGIESPEKM